MNKKSIIAFISLNLLTMSVVADYKILRDPFLKFDTSDTNPSEPIGGVGEEQKKAFATRIDIGSQYGVAILDDGSLTVWGSTSDNRDNTPTGNDFTKVSAGTFHIVGLRSDNSMETWGRNDSGVITNAPINSDQISDIYAGNRYTVVELLNGSLYAWGETYNNQTNVSSVTSFTHLEPQRGYGLYLKTDGSIGKWGSENFYNQQSGVPTGNDFTKVSASDYHGVALREDGTIETWGHNNYGQVSPKPSGNDFIDVSANGYHTVAVRSNGTVEVFGKDGEGQKDVPSQFSFKSVIAGGNHNIGFTNNGAIEGWGWDVYGQVSDAPTNVNF